MTFICGHWANAKRAAKAVENRLHWVKDVTFDKDYPSRFSRGASEPTQMSSNGWKKLWLGVLG